MFSKILNATLLSRCLWYLKMKYLLQFLPKKNKEFHVTFTNQSINFCYLSIFLANLAANSLLLLCPKYTNKVRNIRTY